jgi:hypothetical protein
MERFKLPRLTKFRPSGSESDCINRLQKDSDLDPDPPIMIASTSKAIASSLDKVKEEAEESPEEKKDEIISSPLGTAQENSEEHPQAPSKATFDSNGVIKGYPRRAVAWNKSLLTSLSRRELLRDRTRGSTQGVRRGC